VLSVGLIGTGPTGRRHAHIVAREVSGARLVGVYGDNPAAAASLADDLQTEAYSSAAALIQDTAVDAVAICTPAGFSADHVVAAAHAGKGIFCDKPISVILSEVDDALEMVSDSGVPFQAGFHRRFDPGHASLAAAVVSGEVGEPRIMRITSRETQPPSLRYARRSGGIFLDTTIHDFDIARFVTGSEVVEVYAVGQVRIDPDFETIGDLDTVVITLVHENGCLTAIDNCRESNYGYDQRVEVYGSGGVAMSDNQPIHQAYLRDSHGLHGAAFVYPVVDRYAASYVAQWRAFVAALADSRDPEVGLEDVRRSLTIGLAAWRSVHEHRPVRIAEINPELI
jgi:myo-inositol 2-dehydrogenase / D-chiro-inositol 1-dehydrogenase